MMDEFKSAPKSTWQTFFLFLGIQIGGYVGMFLFTGIHLWHVLLNCFLVSFVAFTFMRADDILEEWKSQN